MAERACACKSHDAYDCWALRYHHHTGVPGMVIDEEGGPCECSCHDDADHEAPRAKPIADQIVLAAARHAIRDVIIPAYKDLPVGITMTGPTPDQLRCLRVIWDAAGTGVLNHEDERLAPFCDDASTLTKPDVFNQCHDLGWLNSKHNGLTDCSFVSLTMEGEWFAANGGDNRTR